MNEITLFDWLELFFALPLAPLAGYVWLYLFLRCMGKLCVNARSWHAESVSWGGRVVWSALRMFGFFQPLLRLESGVARRFARRRPKRREPAVSDVVVELIPLA